MIKLKSRGNETAEQMLRRFKNALEKEGLTKDIKRVAYYEKPSEKRRRRMRSKPKTQLMIRREQAAQEEARLSEGLLAQVEKVDPSDVNELCKTYGLKRSELGRLTGFSLRAMAEWSSGKLPSEPARRRLHEVRRLLDALSEIVKNDAIPSWLGARNPAFDNMTPLQVIEVGEIDRLWQMVYELGSGSPD